MCSSDFSTRSRMRYCFDIDGTLYHTPCNPDGHGMRYEEATSFPWMVGHVNRLLGMFGSICTARFQLARAAVIFSNIKKIVPLSA